MDWDKWFDFQIPPNANDQVIIVSYEDDLHKMVKHARCEIARRRSCLLIEKKKCLN